MSKYKQISNDGIVKFETQWKDNEEIMKQAITVEAKKCSNKEISLSMQKQVMKWSHSEVIMKQTVNFTVTTK